MGKLKFGVSSIVLGKEQKTENLRYDSVEWGEAKFSSKKFQALYNFFYDPGIQKTF